MKKAQMIDVGEKERTKRLARAQAYVRLNREIVRKIKANTIPKGNVLEYARIAGILAVKKTPELIPLTHSIEIDYAGIDFSIKADGILIESLVKAYAKTGVEMEALVGCCAAALTIYDMCKMFSRPIEIGKICLLEKRGGKSGDYVK